MATKAAKRRKKLKSQTATAVETVAPPPPVVPPVLKSHDLIYWHERSIAQAKSAEFDRWLAFHVASNRIPMDEVVRPVELLCVYVEWILLARVLVAYEARHEGRRPPHTYIPGDDHPNPNRPPRTEAEALAMGLNIVAEHPAASFPGCRGADVNGNPCGGLRKYGHDKCPMCESRDEYEEWDRKQAVA